MQIGDLVDDPGLRLELRVAGDQQRAVRWVHAMEVAEPGPFLRGGEVVLTTAAWQRAGQDPVSWVESVAHAGAVALGFGRLLPEDEPPDGLVEAAAEHGLTCFVVPVEIPFVTVIEAFVAGKRVEWEAPLRRQLEHHSAIVAALRGERGVASVVRVMRRRLGLDVAVESDATTYGAAPEPAYRVPLIGEGLADAWLLLPQPLDDLDMDVQAAVSSAMPFLALELERERALRATEQRYAWEVIDWIEAGNVDQDTVTSRLERLGVATDQPVRCLVARETPAVDLADLAPTLLVERGEEVVCLLADPPDRIEVPGYVGVGAVVPVGELRVSLLQARHAAEALLARGTPGWLGHDELASPTLLLSAQDPALLGSMARTVLGGLLDSDRERGTDLVATLRTFLDHGGRWQETADELHIHINTLRHRMARVEELTGRLLASTPDRVDLYLALRAL